MQLRVKTLSSIPSTEGKKTYNIVWMRERMIPVIAQGFPIVVPTKILNLSKGTFVNGKAHGKVIIMVFLLFLQAEGGPGPCTSRHLHHCFIPSGQVRPL